LLDLFEHRFASFEMGLLKPDAAVFEHIAMRLGEVPGAGVVPRRADGDR
jgi:FMN phosphatase YigB (HAD superfamily)